MAARQGREAGVQEGRKERRRVQWRQNRDSARLYTSPGSGLR